MNKRPNNNRKDIKHLFKEAVKFLNNTKIKKDNKKISLSDLPWYLMLGPETTGKTTLLSRSDLKFIVEKKSSTENTIPKTSQCNFWATKNAVIIDSAGAYFDIQNNKSSQDWPLFLKTLKKHSHNTLSGIVFTFGIDQLISTNPKKQKQLFDNTLEHLKMLSKYFSQKIPIYIIINKFDLITGFSEFFDDLSRDERWQIWGLPLNLSKTTKLKEITTLVNAEFDKLFERLNEQVIWRLQHEVNLDKRALINGFPLQIAQLKSHLMALINEICAKEKTRAYIKGVFFTSADRQALGDVQAHAGTNSLSTITQPFTKQAYFAHDLFEKTIFKNGHHVEHRSYFSFLKPFFRWVFYLSLVSVIVGLTLTWVFNFKQQIETVNAANQSITAYEVMMDTNKNQAFDLPLQLKSLNSLLHALQAFKHKQSNASKIFFPNKTSTTLQQKTFTAYQKALNTSFYQAVVKNMTDIINNQATQPNLLYRTLKSYLMLGNPQNFEPDYIKNTMRIIWRDQYSADNQEQLINYLNTLLENKPKSIALDTSLIANARNKLHKLNKMQLAFTLLASNVTDNQLLSLDLNTNKTAAAVLTLVDDNISIPSIYTAKNFSTIYPSLFKQAAQNTLEGNWVLGANSSHTIKSKMVDDFTIKLSNQYLSNYSAVWMKFLFNVKILNFTDMSQLDTALSLLSADNSPLIQLISLIQNNLTDQVASSHVTLNALKNLSQNNINSNASLTNIEESLKQLTTYISSITLSENPDKKNFELTTYRMRNFGQNDPVTKLFTLADQYPEPIKSWLYNIAMNSWELMLFQSQLYINHAWQTNIVPQYNAQIENRYPFTPVANNNVSLESFSYFFSPHGLLNTFFKNYLSAFVDTTKQQWRLKTLDAATLQIPNSTLQTFQTAFDIQQLYFNDMNEKLQVPFTLTPKKIDSNIAKIKFTLGTQKYIYDSNKPSPQPKLLWPDQSNQGLASIVVIDKSANSKQLVENGPWGWLKLMQKVRLQIIGNSHQYTMTLGPNESPTTFNATFKSPENPFLLRRFNLFRLPQEI